MQFRDGARAQLSFQCQVLNTILIWLDTTEVSFNLSRIMQADERYDRCVIFLYNPLKVLCLAMLNEKEHLTVSQKLVFICGTYNTRSHWLIGVFRSMLATSRGLHVNSKAIPKN